MRKLMAFLLSVALGGVLVIIAYEFHIVRTPKGVELVRKQASDWRDAYVDVRGWSPKEWAGHPKLVRNLLVAKRNDVIESSESVPIPPSWFKPISLENEPTDPETEPAAELGAEAEDEK